MPARRDNQKAYATLAENYQRIIVGVIAQREALQSGCQQHTVLADCAPRSG